VITQLEAIGLTSKLSHNFVLGISDKSTVKLDFDGIPLRFVKYWSRRVCNWFDLEGFIIFQSSKLSYHVVFNLPVTWEKNIHIMNWVAVESQLGKLRDYVLMQGIKESSTLRVGYKGDKRPPKIIFHEGKQDKNIQDYIIKRNEIKKMIMIHYSNKIIF
jgi:hypothetical protein